VWYYNAEDSMDEIKRRILAVCAKHEIPPASLTRFYYYSGVENNALKLAASDHHGKVFLNKPALEWMQKQIQQVSAELVVLDPWAGIHACDENANIEIDQLARQLARIASESGIALHIVHHSRKLGQVDGSGDAEITRGASALVAAARYACTLRGMSERDADKFGIPSNVRHRYCRLDDAKLNYSESSDHASWFYRENVQLSHIGPDLPAQGVAVLIPMDLGQIQAEESHVLEYLADYLSNVEEERMTVNALATAIKSDTALFEHFGECSVATLRRKLLNMVKRPLLLSNGRMARIVVENGKAWVTIEEDFIL
jgi:hypothetical protein